MVGGGGEGGEMEPHLDVIEVEGQEAERPRDERGNDGGAQEKVEPLAAGALQRIVAAADGDVRLHDGQAEREEERVHEAHAAEVHRHGALLHLVAEQ